VTNLRCSLEAIQDGLASPDRTTIDALHAETRLLERMIDDLQDLALADAGQLAMRREPVDVGDVLKRAAAAVGRPSSDVCIQLDVPESLPVVTGDADRLTQVFRNLLANALTHSTSGGRIDVRAREESGLVRVDVIDDGRGIEPAHLPHLFDRFYRADRSRSRSTGGAGLGLAIVRQLVVAHGGRVEAHSDGADCGARFSVVLPAAS
jgi:two-component system sensor histidine kinase BaeS